MAFTGVPLMVGGGQALHSSDLMRMLVSNFFYGVPGVIRAPDLRVLALPAPDAAVRVMPGGVAVQNRAVGSDGREAYFDYSNQEILVPISPTGSSGRRTDLIIARVEDPYAAGTQWQYPADRATGPYIHVRVVENVASNVYNVEQLGKGWSAVTLARVDIPANTTTITQNMICDLRSLANGPQRWEEPDPPPTPAPLPPPVTQETWTESRKQPAKHSLLYTDRTFRVWPSSASWRVCIPSWACGVDVFAVVQNPAQHVGNVWGETQVRVGGQYGTPMTFDMDAISTTMPNRIPLFYSTTMSFPAGAAGTIQPVEFRAKMYDDARTRGRLDADTCTVTYINMHFTREPIIN